MDVKCLSCGEPWDTYHLQQDLPHDALTYSDDTEKAIAGWHEGSGKDKPRLDHIIYGTSRTWREALADEGWEFGRVITDVRRCCCCRSKPKIVDERREVLARLLGDDEDGLAADLEDLG